MAASRKPRICWDSCSWISLIAATPGRVEGLVRVARAAERGEIELITSFVALAETAKAGTPTDPDTPATLEKIRAAFESDYVTAVLVDRLVAEKAQELVRTFNVKGADAVHLATAILYEADELHTWDKRLLSVQGQVGKLRIGPADWTMQQPLIPD